MASSSGRNVERIGHRGAPRRFLENTLPSFEEALRLGADAVELDVHVTADGQVVVHHDAALSRQVNPAGLRGRAISTIRSEELAGVDLADGARVPQLSAVLAMARGKAFVYVEVKAGDIAAVAEVIDSSGASCAIHSFDHDAIVAALRVAPHIPRGILFERWPASLDAAVSRTQARDVWPKGSLITVARVSEIHGLGCRTVVWTVNDAARARELADWGVDGICTDDLTVLESRG